MFKLDLEKAEEPEIKLPTFAGSRRKQGTSRKTSASLATLKPLTVWITTNSGKFLKIWEHQTTLPGCWETCIWVKKQQLEPDMEQLTGSKLRKEYVKDVYCHTAFLTHMQSASCNMWAGWITSWNQDCWEKCQLKICRWYHSKVRKWRGTNGPLDESEKGEWKSWLKTQHSKN